MNEIHVIDMDQLRGVGIPLNGYWLLLEIIGVRDRLLRVL